MMVWMALNSYNKLLDPSENLLTKPQHKTTHNNKRTVVGRKRFDIISQYYKRVNDLYFWFGKITSEFFFASDILFWNTKLATPNPTLKFRWTLLLVGWLMSGKCFQGDFQQKKPDQPKQEPSMAPLIPKETERSELSTY